MPRRASGSTRTKSVDEPKRSTIRFSCTRFNSSAFCENANPDEDWTKIPDLAERRRIQNRIAQRNYRKKLKQRMDEQNMSESSSDNDIAMSRKPSAQGNSTAQQIRQPELQWQAQHPSPSVGGSMAAVMTSPTFSDSGSSFEQSGSLFSSGRCSYSPPALSVDEESNYEGYRTHASSIASTSPFTDESIFPVGSMEKPFGEVPDWNPVFDSGFTFDPSAPWIDPTPQAQTFLDPLNTQLNDSSSIFTAADGHQNTLKSDPMLGFTIDQSSDYFAQPWSS